MGKNRVFFPQQVLDRWLDAGDAELSANELTLKAERKKYRLVEGVRVVAEVSGALDPYDITGKVKTVVFLTELGAELLGESMLIGDNAYEVVPGWLGQPRVEASASEAQSPIVSSSDEQLLANFLMRKL
ncbi:MAG TPA: hypothetical protein VGP93_18000 [Polyangiaceae bacterium]|jgi:hypothetical protein|nr:hypothetical protein [Polyangiaceae bacterium]